MQRSIIPRSSGMRYPVNPGATDSGRGASSDEHATCGRTPGTRVKNQCFTKRHVDVRRRAHAITVSPCTLSPGLALDNSTGNSTGTRQATRQDSSTATRQWTSTDLDRNTPDSMRRPVKCQARQLRQTSTDLDRPRHEKTRGNTRSKTGI